VCSPAAKKRIIWLQEDADSFCQLMFCTKVVMLSGAAPKVSEATRSRFTCHPEPVKDLPPLYDEVLSCSTHFAACVVQGFVH
jgi:hypothetical protein